MERFQSKSHKVVAELLDARLVADGRMRVRAARVRFREILAARPVNVIEPFCFQIVRLEIFVRDGPGWRDSAEMADFPKIFFAESEECGAVKFGIASDVVVGVRMERSPTYTSAAASIPIGGATK